MKTLAASLILIFFSIFSPKINVADSTGPDNICGIWITQKEDVKIAITKGEDGLYCAKIVWALSPHHDFVGRVVMKGVKYNPTSNQYICPWLFDPKLEIVARAKITLSGNILNLKATKGIISQSETLTRVRED